jgi:hypothetical protein
METTDNQEVASGDAGLLDGVSINEESQEVQDTSKTDIDHKAAPPDDDEPLERPDWWPENFWKKDESAPDLEGIAKSYQEMRKMVSQGKHKAPADGNYDTSAFGSVPDDDPIKSHVLGWAKEYGVSQLALDALVKDVVAMQGEQQEVATRSIEEERKSLGPNADAMVKSAVDWASGLVRKGIWGKDDFEEFKYAAGTAKGLRMMLKLRETYEGTRIPVQSTPMEGAPSKDELYAMVGDPKYKTDPAYRAKVERLFASNFS